MLYLSGDREEDASDSRLAFYVHPAGGVLAFDSYLQMSIATDPKGWGSEGLAFNPSGSGYGSGADELASVEREGSDRAAIISLNNGNVTDVVATATPEDVTYLGSSAAFATPQDTGGRSPWLSTTSGSCPRASRSRSLPPLAARWP